MSDAPHLGGTVPSASCPQRRILQVGTFDVENFGDALFPWIARWRIGGNGGTEGVTASASRRKLCWNDALPTLPIEDIALDPAGFDLVLFGGGELVHAARGGPYYELDATRAWTANGALWAGGFVLATRWGCPVAWN